MSHHDHQPNDFPNRKRRSGRTSGSRNSDFRLPPPGGPRNIHSDSDNDRPNHHVEVTGKHIRRGFLVFLSGKAR